MEFPIGKKLSAFHLVKIRRISGSGVNGTRFVGSSHCKIPRKSGKSKKVGPFSRLEFPNGMSCSIYVSVPVPGPRSGTATYRGLRKYLKNLFDNAGQLSAAYN